MLLELDRALFHAANGLAGRWPLFDVAVSFCAESLIWLMGAAILTRCVFLIARRDRRAASELASVAHAGAAVVLALVGNWAFAHFIKFRHRPFEAFSDVHLLAAPPYGWQSFPSGHSAAAFAMAFSIFFVDRRFGTWLLCAAALVAASRVFAGVHYPLDVIAGACAGFGWAYLGRRTGQAMGDTKAFTPLVRLPRQRR
ncbi:MAG: hypothetical protein RLZZ324_1142 [Candidatus Parcubacteria bacterium]|jgi:undecaprenyl-diphosphatase